MADDVFKPQARSKLNVTLSSAEATNVVLHFFRKCEVEIVTPRITKVSREVRRKRCIGKCAANEIPITRHTEDRKHSASLIERSQTDFPDVLANFLFRLRRPERDVQHPQARARYRR